MVELLRSPWDQQFNQLVAEASTSVVVCSPYIGAGPCERIRQHAAQKDAEKLDVALLTDLSRDNMLSGAIDVAALAALVLALPRSTVRFLPSLHAKVYIADDKQAIVTSANMTDSGLCRNFEYGVNFRDRAIVTAIRQDVLQYASLGSAIDGAKLATFATVVGELREMLKSVERAGRTRLRREFDQRVRKMDDDVLRARAGGRTAHAIFADAILHLLRKGPMRTVEIHEAIRRIHPDLCDDTVDRVIDGQHFGKKWKHGVRTAQVFLRRRGDIRLVERRWQMVKESE